jgi:hypothetical protein
MIAGTLQIEMAANVARLSKDMNDAKRKVSDTMDSINTAVARTTGLLASIGAGVGFAAIIAGFKGIVDSAARLDDVAERTGATVESLSKLEQVARIGGHSFETAEMSMIRLTKALHGGDDEAKGAGKALAALGLQADALRNKDTAEALRIVAVELNKYEDGAGKTALALDLLGKSGAQALPFLKDLATEQGVSARVTTEQAAAAENLQKAIGRLRNDMQAAGQAIGLSLVPPLLNWIEANREAIRIAGSTGNALRLFVFNLEAMTTEKPREQIMRLTAEIEKLEQQASRPFWQRGGLELLMGKRTIEESKKQVEFLKFLERQEALALGVAAGGDSRGEMQRFGLSGAKLALDYKGVGDAAKKTTEDLSKLRSEVAALAHSMDLPTPPLMGGKDELQAIKKTLEEGRKGWIAYIDAMQAADDAQQTAAGAGKSFTQVSEEITDRVLQSIDPLYSLKKANNELAKSFADGSLRITEEQFALARMQPEVRALFQAERNVFQKIQEDFESGALSVEKMQEATRIAMEKMDKPLEKTNDIAQRLGMTFESTFENLVFGAKDGVKASKLLEAALFDVAKILFRINVTEPLAQGVKDSGGNLLGLVAKGFGGFFSGSAGGSFSGAGATASFHTGGIVGFDHPSLRNVDPAVFHNAPRFHGGGIAGGEVPIVAKRGEGVFTQEQMRALGRGDREPQVVIHQSLTFGSDVNQSTLAVWAQQIRKQTKIDVQDSYRRGGGFKKAMGG